MVKHLSDLNQHEHLCDSEIKLLKRMIKLFLVTIALIVGLIFCAIYSVFTSFIQ